MVLEKSAKPQSGTAPAVTPRMPSPTRGIRNFAERLRRGSKIPVHSDANPDTEPVVLAPEVARARERAARARCPKQRQLKIMQQKQLQRELQQVRERQQQQKLQQQQKTSNKATEANAASANEEEHVTEEQEQVAPRSCENGSDDAAVASAPKRLRANGKRSDNCGNTTEDVAAATPIPEKNNSKSQTSRGPKKNAKLEKPSAKAKAAVAKAGKVKQSSKKQTQVDRLLAMTPEARQEYLETLSEAQQMRLAMQLSMAE